MASTEQFHLIRPNLTLADRGLQVLVGGPEARPGVPLRGRIADIRERVDGFLSYARSIDLDITRQVMAVVPSATPDETHANVADTGRIVGMCLWVAAPGRTAMLFAPNQSEFPESAAGTTAAIIAAIEDARAANITLAQVMLEPADGAGKTVFAAAELTQLATLTYMERKPPPHPPAPSSLELPGGFALEPYTAATHPLFCEAILTSYVDTLDCPALSGTRDIDDIILGHKAVGPFDPQLWNVLLRYGKPVGCLLLGEIPARRALELVYLGLSVPARGQGLGRILMQRVLSIATRRHFDVATLAVDAANGPALHLYRRCGYASVAQRVAMVRRLS